MNNTHNDDLNCLDILKQRYGYSDEDLLNLLGISKEAFESNKMSAYESKNLSLLKAILAKEGAMQDGCQSN